MKEYEYLHENIVTTGCRLNQLGVIILNHRDLHRDMNELDQVTDESHDSETDRDSLGNLNKFYASRLLING